MVDSNYKNTKVYFRFLPSIESNWDDFRILEDRKTLYVRCLQDFEKGREHLEPSYWKFCTDGLLYNNSQEEIFNEITSDLLLDKIFEGNNAIILSYGQTGSGKSITTSGLDNAYEDRGFVPRLIEAIYQRKEAVRSSYQVSVHITCVETNRKYVMDLQGDGMLHDMNSMKNIKAYRAHTCDEALQMIFRAEARKTVRSKITYNSHMANSAITFTIYAKSFATNDTTVGKLHVVDLSGADTAGNVSCLHKNGFEIGTGNLAKTQLEQFILILNEKNTEKILVKQRLCIIINYLKDSLNAHSVLRFIGHIRSERNDTMVSLSMLRFGQLVRGLTPQKLHPKVFKDQETKLKVVEAELVILKKELELNSMLTNVDMTTNLSHQRFQFIERLAEDYLKDKSGEIILLNTTDAVLAMKVFKNYYNRLESEKNFLAEQIKTLEDGNSSRLRDSSISSKQSKRNSIKHSNNSSVSLVRSKKGSSKKKVNRESKDISSIIEESVRNGPRSSKLSVSKSAKRRGSRRKSGDSVSPIKSDLFNLAESEAAVQSQNLLPIEIAPQYESAWNLFVESSSDYKILKDECDSADTQLEEIVENYNREAERVQEIVGILQLRRDELYRAQLLKDLEKKEEIPALSDLEIKCANNVNREEQNLVLQKELLLKLQAELKLAIDARNRAKEDLSQQFQKYCKNKYAVPVPELGNDEAEDQTEKSLRSVDVAIAQTDDVDQKVEPCTTKESLRFIELKKMMRKERKKLVRDSAKNKMWIRSCKLQLETQ
ncbi:PREDICTED: kinesin-like protein KIF9 [Nicrophorus vespilloides]|uniref:Kinesin-like protein KIF9 n=1 Tax=Nicrophorus vespilloides TaxID=110193 RepID=A0ABM1MB05_NICVS|nr:PREDICTED: kinesin-like protein KIF9 [Nicrophorus vespilloides]